MERRLLNNPSLGSIGIGRPIGLQSSQAVQTDLDTHDLVGLPPPPFGPMGALASADDRLRPRPRCRRQAAGLEGKGSYSYSIEEPPQPAGQLASVPPGGMQATRPLQLPPPVSPAVGGMPGAGA